MVIRNLSLMLNVFNMCSTVSFILYLYRYSNTIVCNMRWVSFECSFHIPNYIQQYSVYKQKHKIYICQTYLIDWWIDHRRMHNAPMDGIKSPHTNKYVAHDQNWLFRLKLFYDRAKSKLIRIGIPYYHPSLKATVKNCIITIY